MLRIVGEHPGVKRPLEPLPSWFVGTSSSNNPLSPSSSPQHIDGKSLKEEYSDYTVFVSKEIEIELKEYKLIPDEILVRVESLPVTITFVLHNRGRFSHDFEVEGHGLDAKAPKFAPRKTLNFEVTFTEAGEYKISCPLSNHEERGMKGTLIIRVGK